MRSSSSSSKSLRSAGPMGEIAKSSITTRSSLASAASRRAKLPSPCATCSSSNSRAARTYSTEKPLRAAWWAKAHASQVFPLPVAPVMSKLRAWRSQSPPASAVMRPRSSARVARQLMSSMQAALTLSLAALSSRCTRRSSRQATSRCTSSVSRSSKLRPAAAVLVACSSMARTMPSRRRLRSWSRVCSFNMEWVFLGGLQCGCSGVSPVVGKARCDVAAGYPAYRRSSAPGAAVQGGRRHGWGSVVSVVVVGPAHVLVLDGRHGRGGKQRGLAIQAALEDVGHAAQVGRADSHGPRAGGLQPLGAVAAYQGQQAQAGAVALLRMRAVLELPGDHRGSAHADTLAPADQLGRRPLQMRAVRRRHVLGRRGEAAAHGAHGVAGHAMVGREAFQQIAGDAHVDLGADEPVRHAVVVALELDVVVDVDLGAGLPAADGITLERHGPQRRRVERLEGTATAAGQLLERSLVEVDEQLGDGPVQLGQAEEAAVAQPGQDPPLHQQNRALDLGLVAGMSRASSQDRAAVVTSEFLVGSVGFGVVAVGGLDERARLVGHDQAGHAADELQRLHLRADPVGGGLARRGAGVGVVRRAQRGHEDLGLRDLAGGRVNDGHGVAGVVDKQLLAGNVDLAHRALLALGELGVLDAKARVLVGQRVARGVLLPQQHQGDARALELLVHDAEVRGELVAAAGQRRAVHPGLQLFVCEALGKLTVHACHPGQGDVLAHRALGDLQRAADLAVAQAGLQVQAQCLSDLSHRDSVGWHRLGPQKAVSLRLVRKSLARHPRRPRSR
mmetsp:Transcript_6076/g.24370  ORF Transcript_6076/g.24370 Transcript_6076/m.24370 type:complete len:788 (+) Transcript_6076:480-2843(+)